MNEERPVLVLAGTPRVVHTVSRCLHGHGITVDVACWGAQGALFRSRSVRSVHRLPDFWHESFWGTLEGLIERHGYDALIPTTDESLLAIAPFYRQLRQRLYPGCPAPDVVSRVLDKRLTLQAAEEVGIAVPREYRFSNLQDLELNGAELRFPVLAKPASKADEFNFDVRYFDTSARLRQAFLDQPSFGNKYLLQEFCPGHGVGVEILLWEGKIHAAFQHRRLKELPASGGVSVVAEAQAVDPRLLEDSVRLLGRLNWQGAAMVEYRHDPSTSRTVLMEVNGRYWGSLPLSVQCGVEFPYYEWQLAHGRVPGPAPAYRAGNRVIWRTGDLLRFIGLAGQWKSGKLGFGTLVVESGKLVGDLWSPRPDALWKWGDPVPAIRELHARIISRAFRPAVALKLVPRGIRNHASVYRYCGLRLGLRYTYLKLLYALHLRGGGLASAIRRAKSFVFVCSGNIMRSPFAAALLKEYSGGREIRSAGLFAKPGNHADPVAVTAAREAGVALDGHLASELSAEMVQQSDVIFVMDHINEAVLLTRFPYAARKTFLLGALQSGGRPKEIADPYGQGLDAVRRCYSEVRRSVMKLAESFQDEPSLCE
jgi:protein-tyrosine-phosphatase/predicted ATP-grasp superfamily ATP-dependent carboligase